MATCPIDECVVAVVHIVDVVGIEDSVDNFVNVANIVGVTVHDAAVVVVVVEQTIEDQFCIQWHTTISS